VLQHDAAHHLVARAKLPGSPGVHRLMTTCAFLGTNPTDELITSGWPVNRAE